MPPNSEHLQVANTITEIRVELGKLATRLEKIDDLTRSLEEQRRQLQEMTRKVDEIEDLALKALESTKSAHYRLNAVNRVAYWILTAAGGTVIITVVRFMLSGGFGSGTAGAS